MNVRKRKCLRPTWGIAWRKCIMGPYPYIKIAFDSRNGTFLASRFGQEDIRWWRTTQELWWRDIQVSIRDLSCRWNNVPKTFNPWHKRSECSEDSVHSTSTLRNFIYPWWGQCVSRFQYVEWFLNLQLGFSKTIQLTCQNFKTIQERTQDWPAIQEK